MANSLNEEPINGAKYRHDESIADSYDETVQVYPEGVTVFEIFARTLDILSSIKINGHPHGVTELGNGYYHINGSEGTDLQFIKFDNGEIQAIDKVHNDYLYSFVTRREEQMLKIRERKNIAEA